MTIATQQLKSSSSLRNAILGLMDDAATAQAFRTHSPGGDHSRATSIPVSIARSKVACLGSESLVGLFDATGRLRRTPGAAPSSDDVPMSLAVIANSRTARAGAGLIAMPDKGLAHPVGKTGVVAIEKVPGFVRTIDAAPFATVNVDSLDEVGTSPLPIKSSEIDLTTATAKAVRFVVNRKERMRQNDQDAMADQIIASIVLGLGRAADSVLLEALSSASLSPFTLAAAAAADLQVDELRALAGTNAAATTIGDDGELRVAGGVLGELTPDMAGTIVGAWNRAAVAVLDDISIHFERTGLQGQMAVTCWASMQAQTPDVSKFWTVA